MADLSGQNLGRYHLTERLGQGGMATVYKGHDTLLERDVAVKIIRTGAFPEDMLEQVLKRFEREAKSLAKLSHPNIVKVYDYGEHEGSPYLVMEYLPGGTLKQYISKPMPWQEAVRLLLPIARGVGYAHQRGILHRDIKPANILITDGGESMLSDFGIAKLFESEQTAELTGSGVAIGTPEYMAPEQWNGEASPQSDLYSLAIVLYELVAGQKPFVADTPAGILIKQATEAVPSPRKFAADLPEAVEQVLIKALARDPQNRFKDVQEFVRALEGVLASAGIESPVPKQEILEKSATPLPTQVPPAHDGKTLVDAVAESPKTEATLPPSIAPAKKRSRNLILVGSFGLIAIVLGLVWSLWPGTTPTTPASTVTATFTLLAATSTNIVPSATPADTAEPTITPLPAEITDTKGVKMELVPAGEFSMGNTLDQALAECRNLFQSGADENCKPEYFTDETPQHKVSLAAYYIDQYEVSNALYEACVDAGVCAKPVKTDSQTHSPYYGAFEYRDYPVIWVDWSMAKAYCSWRGARLPTEAEWEKAARGDSLQNYPWGNSFDGANANSCDKNCSQSFASINFDDGFADVAPVNAFPGGVSIYNVFNLAGNVSEWIADWYAPNMYSNSTGVVSDPTGPLSGTAYVIRGGSWLRFPVNLRVMTRSSKAPDYSSNDLGFRCASDVAP